MTINGLPAHILIVHAVVVLIPLVALLAVVAACWPAARRRLGVSLPIAGAVAFVTAPVAQQVGTWLQQRLPDSAIIRQHAGYGEAATAGAFGLLVACVAVWWVGRRRDRAEVASADGHTVADTSWVVAPWARIATMVVAVVLSALATFTVYLAGDSGARAAWEGKFSPTVVTHVQGG